MTIKNFEDLEIWKEARVLSKLVFDLTKSAPFNTDFRFRDQIRASSGSAFALDIYNLQGKRLVHRQSDAHDPLYFVYPGGSGTLVIRIKTRNTVVTRRLNLLDN